MEILDLRLIRSQDLLPLLEEERVAWRDRLRWDYSATAAMVTRFMDARALNGYALREGGRVVGYAFYVVEYGKGLIGDAFISAAFRDGVNEVQLATHMLETLQATPGLRRIEAQLLNLDCEPLRQHFCSQGFQLFERQFLFLSIADAAVDAGLGAPPAILEPWDSRYFQAAAGLIQSAYRGHVDSRISDQYQTQAGTVRFLENIIRFPGCGNFLPPASFLAFAPGGRGRGELCGMILTSVVSDGVAHITQLCVSPTLRGRGLGRRLIGAVTDALRQHRFEGATLTVTVANTAAMDLYRSLGFTRLSAFPAFAWDAPQRPPRTAVKRLAIRG